MKLSGIDHVALTCRSVEASTKWYQTVLGFERVFADQWSGVPVFLKRGDAALALFPHAGNGGSASGGQPRIDHFALLAETQADFAEAQDSLRRLRIEFVFQDHEVSHSIYFRDPDGHRVEITTYDV